MSGYLPGRFLHLLALVWLAGLTAVPVHALADPCGVNRNVAAQALEQHTWDQLNRVFEKVEEEEYDSAHENIVKMLDRAGARDRYLRAVLNQAAAQIEWSRENYDAALRYFERAVELDSIPDQAHFALMYQIAQLYYMNGRYDEALQKLELWFCTVPDDEITSHAWVLKAVILAQKGDYAAALPAIETAIAVDPEPEENWYQLKLAAHYEQEQYPLAAETLEVMIVNWPEKKTYWTHLAQIYYKIGKSEEALAISALAYRKKLLGQQWDLAFLSSMYHNGDLPYKAAEVLEKGISDGIVEGNRAHWTLIADAWYAAGELERSLFAYDQAGRVAEDGSIDLRRGYILVDLERWPEAQEALDRSLEKGGLSERETGEAYLLRGLSHFHQENFDRAGADWSRAGRHENSKKAAGQWMNHLREERQREAT